MSIAPSFFTRGLLGSTFDSWRYNAKLHCIASIDVTGWQYVAPLTLKQAMALYWRLETLSAITSTTNPNGDSGPLVPYIIRYLSDEVEFISNGDGSMDENAPAGLDINVTSINRLPHTRVAYGTFIIASEYGNNLNASLLSRYYGGPEKFPLRQFIRNGNPIGYGWEYSWSDASGEKGWFASLGMVRGKTVQRTNANGEVEEEHLRYDGKDLICNAVNPNLIARMGDTTSYHSYQLGGMPFIRARHEASSNTLPPPTNSSFIEDISLFDFE